MKDRIRRGKRMLAVVVLVSVLAVAALVPSVVQAAPTADVDASCQAGMEWLADTQAPDGSWPSWYSVSATGLAVLKFETHAAFMGLSPLDPAYAYSSNVAAGLDYILNNCFSAPIVMQPAGDPDTNGNGIGVRAYSPSAGPGHEMYETGIALMAISASQSPGVMAVAPSPQAGRLYADIAQDMIDYIAFAQHDPIDCHQGGWRYSANYSTSDNSISGYVALGLDYASSGPPWGFGLMVPPFVFSEMNIFVNNVQASGGANDGGSTYVPCDFSWVNTLKTGNLLAELAMVGDTQASPRVQSAVGYIERHWDDNNSDPGWKNNYQACFTLMKGFQALGIETIEVDRGGPTTINWYDEMADYIVSMQNADGSWSPDYWGDQYLATAWALLALEKAAPPALEMDPAFATNPVGTNHTVTATYEVAGVPQQGVTIDFEVIAGPNAGASASTTTDVNGQASFTYTSNGNAGTDTIKATARDQGGVALVSAQATKVWESPTAIPGMVGWSIIATVLALSMAFVLVWRSRSRRAFQS